MNTIVNGIPVSPIESAALDLIEQGYAAIDKHLQQQGGAKAGEKRMQPPLPGVLGLQGGAAPSTGCPNPLREQVGPPSVPAWSLPWSLPNRGVKGPNSPP